MNCILNPHRNNQNRLWENLRNAQKQISQTMHNLCFNHHTIPPNFISFLDFDQRKQVISWTIYFNVLCNKGKIWSYSSCIHLAMTETIPIAWRRINSFRRMTHHNSMYRISPNDVGEKWNDPRCRMVNILRTEKTLTNILNAFLQLLFVVHVIFSEDILRLN